MISKVEIHQVGSAAPKGLSWLHMKDHSGVYKAIGADNYFVSFGNGIVLSVPSDGIGVVSKPSGTWEGAKFELANVEIDLSFRN